MIVLSALALFTAIAAVNGQQISFITFLPNGLFFPNPNGASQTYSATGGGIDLKGPFFQSMGSNGRSCGTCHVPSDGMSVSAADVQLRFLLTQGQDPIFRPVDGSNCDRNIDVSTLRGKEAAYSLLRTKGLIRIALAVPANANYRVVSVNNPYGCNESDVISQYRRPLPATNLRFLSAVMVDGRESSPATGTTKILYSNYPDSLIGDLKHQALDATVGHAQGEAKHVRDSLAKNGTWMIVEPYANNRTKDNLNPVGRVYYSFSTLLCTPCSRSQEVALCLGAQAGEEKIREVVTSAGFSRFGRAAETPFNIVYEANP